MKLFPQERVQQWVPQFRETFLEVERLHSFERVQRTSAVDIPEPPVMEESAAADRDETVEVVRSTLCERVQQNTDEQRVPQTREETFEAVLCEGEQQRIAEQIGDVPQGLKETVKVVIVVPHEREQERTGEQTEEPRFAEVTVEAVTFIPRERVQQRTVEQIMDVFGHR